MKDKDVNSPEEMEELIYQDRAQQIATAVLRFDLMLRHELRNLKIILPDELRHSFDTAFGRAEAAFLGKLKDGTLEDLAGDQSVVQRFAEFFQEVR